MGDTTGIGWTEKTWNPWHGCTKVSPGCDNCYMFREKRQYGQDPELVVKSKTKFTDPLKWKDPALVFTCSWSDFFHKVGDQWRPDAWDIIRRTPHLTYQILTKRPSRILRHLPPDWGNGYPNVWMGVSAESQFWYDKRVPLVLAVPAAVHWGSFEPLIGAIKMRHEVPKPLDWVVAGGESGPGAREAWTDWFRMLRDDAAILGTKFFLKQLGGHPDARAHERAVLDGRTHVDMPRVGIHQ